MRGENVTYQGKLSNGDLHAVSPQVSQTEDTGTISNNNDIDLQKNGRRAT